MKQVFPSFITFHSTVSQQVLLKSFHVQYINTITCQERRILKKFSFNTGYCFVHLETPFDNGPSILFIQLYHATVKLNIGLAFVYFLNVNSP